MTNWDNEIDRIARHLSAGEPDRGFTRRVLTRIEAIDAARWSRGAARTWAAAAVAALVAALLVARPDMKPNHAPDPEIAVHIAQESDRGVAAPSATKAPAAARKQSSDKSATPSAVADAGRRGNRPPGDAVVTGASELVPLPIEITPLEIDAMESMESIGVTRLAVAPIGVPALSSDSE